MRLQQKKSPKKAFLVITALLILAGGLYAYIAIRSSDTNHPTETVKNKSDKTKGGEDQSKTSDSDNSTSDKETPVKENDPPKQYEGSNPNTSSTLTGIINYKSVANGSLTLRITIDQSLTSGTCILKLTSAGSYTVTKNTSVISNPSSSACDGFSIPVSELFSGQWNIEVTVTSGNRTGVFKDTITI